MTLELRRQLFHLILGWVLIFFIFIHIFNAFILGIIFVASFILVLLHLSKKTRNIKIIHWLFDTFDRKTKPYQGVVSYLFASFIVVLFFDQSIALASLAILATGDAAATLFGKHFQGPKLFWNKNKTFVGLGAGIIVSILAATIFVPLLPAVIASVAAMLAETLDQYIKTDDNLLVTFVAAIILILF